MNFLAASFDVDIFCKVTRSSCFLISLAVYFTIIIMKHLLVLPVVTQTYLNPLSRHKFIQSKFWFIALKQV